MAKDESIFDEIGGAGAVEPPPRRSRFRRADTGRAGAKSPGGMTDKDLRKSLVDFFSQTAPGIASFAGDEYDAHVIQKSAERLADSYMELGKASPRFRGLLVAAASAGGPFAGAVFATAAVALPILHHHRVISLPPMFGLALIGEPLETHVVEPTDVENAPDGHAGSADIPPGNSGRVTADAV